MYLKTLLSILITTGMFLQAAQAQTALPLDIERLSDRVLVMSPKTGNSRVVVLNSARGLVMLDSGWSPSQARRLRAIAERTFNRSDWQGVIVTSEEFLGNGGTGAFSDAVVIAHEGFRAYLNAHVEDMNAIMAARRSEFLDRVSRTKSMLDTLQAGPERRRGLEEWLELCQTIADDLEGGFSIPYPDITFSDCLTLDLGDLTIECFYFGDTAEQGSVVVRVPEENLVWMGDVFHAMHVLPYGYYSEHPPDIERWLEVLDDLLSGDPQTMKVYRANGDGAWSWQAVSDRRRLIADINRAVREARDQGESLEDLLARLTDVETAFPYVSTWRGTMIQLVSDDVQRTVEGLWRERR